MLSIIGVVQIIPVLIAFAKLAGLAAVAIGLSDCGSSSSDTPVNKNNGGGTGGTGGAGGTGGMGGTGAANDAGEDADAYVDGGLEPWNRPGFNGKFSDPKTPTPCPVLDMDLKENLITLMCGKGVHRMGRININANNPLLSADALISEKSDVGALGNIDTACTKNAVIYPAQIVGLANGSHIVPLNAECSTADAGTFVKSGMAYLDSAKNDQSTINFLDNAKYGSGASQMEIRPVSVRSAAMTGSQVLMPASEEITGNGALLKFGFQANSYNINYGSMKALTFASGKNPTAVEMLDDTHALVLNTAGGGMSFQLSSASLDIVDISSSDPALAIGSNRIDLAVANVVSLPELALTADKKYAVVAGGSGSNLSKILIVDIAGKKVAGSIDLSIYGEVRGIDIQGQKAYISMESGANTSESGKVVIVDFSNPANPSIVEKAINVGHDLGAISVHASGIVYVAATSRYWEAPLTTTDPAQRWTHIVAFDPAAVWAAPVDAGASDAAVDGGK